MYHPIPEPVQASQKKTVKALREQYGWKQWQLAVKAGVSQRVLSQIEANDKPVSRIIAAKIAIALGIPLDCLLIAIIRQ